MRTAHPLEETVAEADVLLLLVDHTAVAHNSTR